MKVVDTGTEFRLSRFSKERCKVPWECYKTYGRQWHYSKVGEFSALMYVDHDEPIPYAEFLEWDICKEPNKQSGNGNGLSFIMHTLIRLGDMFRFYDGWDGDGAGEDWEDNNGEMNPGRVPWTLECTEETKQKLKEVIAAANKKDADYKEFLEREWRAEREERERRRCVEDAPWLTWVEGGDELGFPCQTIAVDRYGNVK